MRFGRIIAILMAVFLCAALFASCNKTESNGNGPDETEPVYYTVSFNTGVEDKIESKTVRAGSTLSEPPEPVRDGYVFEGWYNGSVEWDFLIKVKSDMILTARWVMADSVFTHRPEADGETTVVTGIIDGKKGEHIRLPSYIGGYRVTAVGDNAFSGLSSEEVRKITVPEGITDIGNGAFEGCADIEIIIEGEILSVGDRSFFGCNKLEEIKFGKGIESVSDWSFVGTGLKLVALPESVKTVGENAFFECEALKILILHDKIEAVKDMAFVSSALESVLIYGSADTLDKKVVGRNDEIASAVKYIYSEKKPTAKAPDGCQGYWHYNDKGEAKAWQ